MDATIENEFVDSQEEVLIIEPPTTTNTPATSVVVDTTFQTSLTTAAERFCDSTNAFSRAPEMKVEFDMSAVPTRLVIDEDQEEDKDERISLSNFLTKYFFIKYGRVVLS